MKKLIMLSIATLISSLFSVKAQSWLWAKQGKNANKQLDLTAEQSIAMDKYHNVYETGQYTGDTLIFGSDNLVGTLHEQNFEVYLVKYDENGNVLWAQTSKSTSSNNTNASSSYVITDSKNNVYITGAFEDTLNFQSFFVYAPKNFTHAFLVKYDVNGNVKWAKQSTTPYPGYSATGSSSIALDKSDNLYITGDFQLSASFGSNTLTGTVNPNAFLVKYDSNGNVLWARKGINGVLGSSDVSSVITDNMDNIYITGDYNDSVTFGTQTLTTIGTYQYNLFFVKYDSNGNVIWAKQSNLPKGNSTCIGNALGKDNSNNIYLTGYFYDTVSFGTYTFINPLYKYHGGASLFWAKYNNNGNLLYAKQALEPDSLSWQGFSITTDAQYNLYLTGSQGNNGTRKAKIIFGAETLQSKVRDGCVWLKFDSNGTVLNSYIFSGGGGNSKVPTVIDTSGCYVYFGGTINDTFVVFGSDTVGANYEANRPFVARWSDGECTEKGINNIESQDHIIDLFPNPNNGKFSISISNPELLSGSQNIIEIYNILGAKVYNAMLKPINQIQGGLIQRDYQINLFNQPSGVYILTLHSANQIFYKKLIIDN